ncbi:uncharacterized protein KQ657_003070 [Scheffersomyces spartinae]|uniref:Triacylglycerol lipase n=1 Tax=Scheffersomyces spartinae TaxID=45513 RepID=A0A9P7V5E4_9ASCO|nr:uncharacterized protein KQ657_003070 [Scheffersomyces spartinae]KAG7191475.1 hypothetical protein KQ657_003070 [Scheffersomyces spartinae]
MAVYPAAIEKSWLLKIKSEDSMGNQTCFMATLLKPPNAKKNKLVSYQTAEDSASVDCAPLYAFKAGSSDATTTTRIEILLINTMLSKGYYVITPDYEGLDAAFAAAIREGKHTLDGVRAALKSGSFSGLSNSPDTVMWGYSGGSIATGWAAAQQPEYAPELKTVLRGACMGGMVTNLTSLLMHLDGSIYAGLMVSGLGGLSREYPSINATIHEKIKPDMIKQAFGSYDHCMAASIIQYFKAPVFVGDNHWIKHEGYGVLNDPRVSKIMNNLTYQSHENYLPQIPVFVYQGIKDDIIPINGTEVLYKDWCDKGIKSFEFAVSESTGHIKEAVFGSPAAVKWVDKMINGGKAIDGCKRTLRYSNFNYPSTNVSAFAHAYDSSLRAMFNAIEGFVF